MGSMAAEDVTSTSSVILKSEPTQDGYTPSSPSSNGDLEIDISGEAGPSEPVPVVKRKGGRKPIYATSEERKQRNRQAQAAFRERRTEYIKQLEKTIQHHEETLQTLQQSHRTAADECLMLRYKNSLLERILLEKGIDVQAELRLKSSPHLRPIRQGPSITSQASAMQKAMMNRQQQQRQQRSAVAPVQTVNTSPVGLANFSGSPNAQPTPSSQQASPQSLRSPAFPMQSPTSDISMQQQQQQQQQQAVRPNNPSIQTNPYTAHPRSHVRNTSSTASSHQFSPVQRQTSNSQQMQQGFYPTPFQKHYDQLDQEYDAPADMLDDGETDDIDADSFIPNFRLPPSNNNNGGMGIGMQASPPTTSSGISEAGNHQIPFDYDPMLDADPFGLSASMHFPNPFPFPTSTGRR